MRNSPREVKVRLILNEWSWDLNPKLYAFKHGIKNMIG
jgi:hypothetical protein